MQDAAADLAYGPPAGGPGSTEQPQASPRQRARRQTKVCCHSIQGLAAAGFQCCDVLIVSAPSHSLATNNEAPAKACRR